MIIRNILVQILDIVWRCPKMKSKTSSIKTASRSNGNNRYIFMADGRIPHGGMFDRLKGCISIYAISKALNKDFRIDWTEPFDLRKYLEPVKHDWTIDEKQMHFGWANHNVVIAYGEISNPKRLWKNRTKETHFYYGYNSIPNINKEFKTEYNWGKLYRELFRPTAYLQNFIDKYNKEIGSKYIAIHTRFLNLLGDKNETDINPELPEEEKHALIRNAIKKIKEIGERYTKEHGTTRIMIASDSMNFISSIKRKIPSVYIVPGTVKHIDTAKETNDAENIKVFTDYYLIANAQHVFSLWHEGMWKSAFPEYAALIGNKPFTRIKF